MGEGGRARRGEGRRDLMGKEGERGERKENSLETLRLMDGVWTDGEKGKERQKEKKNKREREEDKD